MRQIMFAIWLACATSLAGFAAQAETALLILKDLEINVPVPAAYEDVSAKKGVGKGALLLATRKVEPWEKIGEYSEFIYAYGFYYADSDPTVQQDRFDALFVALQKGLAAKAQGKTYQPNTPKVANGAYNEIMARLAVGGAANIALVENAPFKKSLVFDSGHTLPGVVTYPLVEDISMVRVKGRLVVCHSWRVAFKPNVRKQLIRTSQRLRDAIVRANR